MPYDIVKGGSKARPWRIVRKSDGSTVGTSTSREKALASMYFRIGAEKQKKPKQGI